MALAYRCASSGFESKSLTHQCSAAAGYSAVGKEAAAANGWSQGAYKLQDATLLRLDQHGLTIRYCIKHSCCMQCAIDCGGADCLTSTCLEAQCLFQCYDGDGGTTGVGQ